MVNGIRRALVTKIELISNKKFSINTEFQNNPLSSAKQLKIMDKYLLTIIGNFKSDKECSEIAMAITPIVDSPHLKFQHSKGVLLFHFETEVDKEEVFVYIQTVLFGITETFILTEITDNVSVSVPEDIKVHLFDLENVSDDVSINIDMRQVKNNPDLYMEEEEEEDFVALLLGEREQYLKRPTLDQILDKILSKGYQSLSPFEQDILDGYSKK